MSVERVIRNVFVAEDRISGTLQKIRNRGQLVSKSMKQISKDTALMGRGFYVAGRRIAFAGFVMSAVFRRVNRALKLVFNTFKKLVAESADIDKTLSWLGDTLGKLALGGQLTEEVFDNVLRVWTEMFDNALVLGSELAELDVKFQDLKNAVVDEIIPVLGELNDKLDTVDWEAFRQKVADAAAAFLEKLKPAILGLITDENLTEFGSNLETLGTLAGSFSAGFIGGIEEMLTGLADLDLLAGTPGEPGGLEGIATAAGNVTAKLGMIAVPTIFVGGAIGTFGMAIKGVAAIIGGPAAFTLAAVTAIVIADFEHWATSVGPDLMGALGDLGRTIGGDEGSGLRAFLKGMSIGVEIVVRGIETWIRVLDTVIKKLQAIRDMKQLPGGGGYGDLPEMQRGGFVPATGAYVLHAGERVIPAGRTTHMGGVNIHIHGVSDPGAVARKVRSVLITI